MGDGTGGVPAAFLKQIPTTPVPAFVR